MVFWCWHVFVGLLQERVHTLLQSPSSKGCQYSVAIDYSSGTSWCKGQRPDIASLALLKVWHHLGVETPLNSGIPASFNMFFKKSVKLVLFALITVNIVLTRKCRIVRLWNKTLKNYSVTIKSHLVIWSYYAHSLRHFKTKFESNFIYVDSFSVQILVWSCSFPQCSVSCTVIITAVLAGYFSFIIQMGHTSSKPNGKHISQGSFRTWISWYLLLNSNDCCFWIRAVYKIYRVEMKSCLYRN